jgi:hypothetical protein
VFVSEVLLTAIEVSMATDEETSFVRAILIDPIRRVIQPHCIDGGLASLQAAVGGLIGFGTEIKTGDVLYVDDEGLLKPNPAFFKLGKRTFAGFALLVGPERPHYRRRVDGRGDRRHGLLRRQCRSRRAPDRQIHDVQLGRRIP